ncbi:copper chaperone PCu(A)C [uncultured Corynebacterium sp.]|uniref:copper chaperone PCu(A)C n=1 Tax=uncultured Corynebacterium sp. TaxID=159447 RepID=UPI0025FE1BB9|nr:copper chaperone PCu(A)C [uncultured Corynebacterium sp.]
MKLHRTTTALVAGSAAIALVLAGCTTDADDAATASESTSATASEDTDTEASTVMALENGYIKEKPADKEMTAIFGTLKNNTEEDVDLVDFRIEGLDEGTEFEQHATEDGKMFEIEGGHSIPAGGELAFAPGGAHLMIMDNEQPMEQGQLFTIVLEFSDGSTLTQELEVRVQPAGEEDYGEDGELTAPGDADPDAGVADEHAGHEGH